MKSWPFVTAMLMLIITWGVIQSQSHGEPVLAKNSFSEFPMILANRWKGQEVELDQKVLKVLKLTDYLMRRYVPLSSDDDETLDKKAIDNSPGGSHRKQSLSPIWLYVGYYKSQRSGATYHSPKNCLPGAGWQFVRSEYVTIPLRRGQEVTINRVLIQKGLDQRVILYWYHDRGRVIASEYWAKAYMIWDAITMNRTDGSLVRISIPVVKSPEEAYRNGVKFLQDLWPVLLEFMPGDIVKVA